jgi:hypothetical protein
MFWVIAFQNQPKLYQTHLLKQPIAPISFYVLKAE